MKVMDPALERVLGAAKVAQHMIGRTADQFFVKTQPNSIASVTEREGFPAPLGARCL